MQNTPKKIIFTSYSTTRRTHTVESRPTLRTSTTKNINIPSKGISFSAFFRALKCRNVSFMARKNTSCQCLNDQDKSKFVGFTTAKLSADRGKSYVNVHGHDFFLLSSSRKKEKPYKLIAGV